jgi:hypothetical protein
MISFGITIAIAIVMFVVFLGLQVKYFLDTKKFRGLFLNFFAKEKSYEAFISHEGAEEYPQIGLVGREGSDLNALIKEINTYLYKTKGTSDYEFIRNKVERKLNMRYDQSTVYLSFPTYLGLMGTFLGVFTGILTFILGFDDAGSVSDESIKNLLAGVLVSMSTSLVGLALTTYNTHKAGEARKKIEDDKNEFFDFIQTEVTKTASASLVSAISKLHDTVDKFEPAFDKVINRFQTTFDNCTKAFGDNFEKNVVAVADAVDVMGKNMDKINDNIELQKRLIDTVKSNELVRGMDRYIEAANHFVSITQSLNKFEEARRMMLAAAQESIALQNKYSDSLKVVLEIAIRVNQVLDRIKNFETSINELGDKLNRRDILGNDVLNTIQNQINGISKKGKIADKFLQMSDGKLNDLYEQQTKVLTEMNKRYQVAIEGHISGFEEMIKTQTEELEARHQQFLQTLEVKFNIEDIRAEFSNLKKLNEILSQLQSIANDGVKSSELKGKLQSIQDELGKIESATLKIQPAERKGWFNR